MRALTSGHLGDASRVLWGWAFQDALLPSGPQGADPRPTQVQTAAWCVA